METKSKVAFSFLTVMSVSLVVVVSAFASTKAESTLKVKGDEPSTKTDITTEMLNNTSLESAVLKQGSSEKDAKFKVVLADGNYIQGAIICRDCGHQSLGSTLGDYMTFTNVNAQNAYNFNVLFSFEREVKSVAVSYTIEFDNENHYYQEHPFVQVKCGHLDPNNFYSKVTSEYDNLKLIANANRDPASVVYEQGDPYHSQRSPDISYGNNVNGSIEFSYGVPNATLAAVQFTHRDDYIANPNTTLRFKINAISFTYLCNW